MSLARHGAGTFVSRVLSFAFGLVSSVLLARTLGPSGKGVYALAILAADMLLVLVHCGAGSAAVHHYGKGKLSLQEILTSLLWLAALLGGASLGLYHLGYPWLRHTVLREVDPKLSLVAVLIVPLGILWRYLNYVQLGTNRIVGYNLVFMTPSASVALICAALWFGGQLDAQTAVFAWAGGQLLTCLVAAMLTLRGRSLSFMPNSKAMRSLLSYGLRVQMVLIANQLHYRGDLFLLGYFRNAAEVGQYTIAVSIGAMLTFLPESLGLVLFRRVASDREGRSEASAITARLTNAVMLITVGAAATAAAWLIPLVYGEQFRPSVVGLWALLPGILGLGLFKIMGSDLMGRGRPGLVGGIALGALVLNLVANLVFIPRFGFVGAALASSVSYCVLGGAVLAFFLRTTGLGLGDVLLVRSEDLRRAVRGLKGPPGKAEADVHE